MLQLISLGSESDTRSSWTHDCSSFRVSHAKTVSMLSMKLKNDATYPKEDSLEGTLLLQGKDIRKRMLEGELRG